MCFLVREGGVFLGGFGWSAWGLVGFGGFFLVFFLGGFGVFFCGGFCGVGFCVGVVGFGGWLRVFFCFLPLFPRTPPYRAGAWSYLPLFDLT